MNLKPITHFALAASIILPMACATTSMAAEKSLWQKFTSFFDPSPSVEGEGPEYDELRAMDEEINKLEGKYSRERRPGNKARIKKEMEALREKRDKLADEIEKKEKAQKSGATVTSSAAKAASSANVILSSSSFPTSSADALSSSAATPITSSATESENEAAACSHDTVFVHDTVTVHDTLYVIVANPQGAAPTENKK